MCMDTGTQHVNLQVTELVDKTYMFALLPPPISDRKSWELLDSPVPAYRYAQLRTYGPDILKID